MKGRRMMVLVVILAMWPLSALAQKTPDDAPQPPAVQSTPPPNEDPRLAAARIIEEGGNSTATFFQNTTPTGGPATITHRRSGLTCVFEVQPPRGQLTIYPSPTPQLLGDDVSCTMFNPAGRGFLETLYATRYPTGDLAEHFAGAVGEIRARFGAAEPWVPQVDQSVDPTLPPIRTARFRVIMDGVPSYTRMSIAQVGDWTVMLRFSTPIADAEAGDRAATAEVRRAIMQVRSATAR